jgi:hypothetical protein
MAAKTEEEPVLKRHPYCVRKRKNDAYEIKVTTVTSSTVDKDCGVFETRMKEAADVLRLGSTRIEMYDTGCCCQVKRSCRTALTIEGGNGAGANRIWQWSRNEVEG